MESTEPVVTSPSRRPVLNDRIPLNLASQDGKVFHLFPFLPWEIRMEIWRCALRRRRFVRLYSSWGRFESPNLIQGSRYNGNAYTTRNELGNLVSGQLYATSPGPRDGWESRRFPSALMAVSHEARAMALEFYYLRLPASAPQRFLHDGHPPWIYLNPDWDYVRLAPTMPLDMMDFLWDCAQYDPDGEGIKHWVVTPVDIGALIRANNTPPMGDWRSPVRGGFGAILSKIKTVVYSHRDTNNILLGPRGIFSATARRERDRRRPIFARSSEFTLLDHDPREATDVPADPIWVTDDPVEARHAYHYLLWGYGLRNSRLEQVMQATEILHMICVRPQWTRASDGTLGQWITDRTDLDDLLLVDENAERADTAPRFRGVSTEALFGDDDVPDGQGTDAAQYGSDESQSSSDGAESELMALAALNLNPVETAVGFWLLPTDAFEAALATSSDQTQTLWSVGTHRPRLGLFSLPARVTLL